MAIGRLFTPRQASELTGLAYLQVRRLIASGKLPAKNVGAGSSKPRWVIRECDLEDFLCPPALVKKEKSQRRNKRVPLDANVDREFTYGD